MTPSIPVPAKPKKPSLDDCSTPIWTPERGERLAIMRMKRFIDQHALAAKLGVSQSVIARIERGSLRVPEKPFTMAELKQVFEKEVSFIMFGTGAEGMNERFYKERYWTEINKRKGVKKES